MLLDVGGQDATEAFEDVGHSDEAREILDGLLVGDLKRMVRCSQAQGLHFPRRAWALHSHHLGWGRASHWLIYLPCSTIRLADAIRSCSQVTRPPPPLPKQHPQAPRASQKVQAWASVSTRSCYWEVSPRLEHTNIFR